MRTTNILGLAAGASLASAHTIFVQLESGGTTYPVSHGVRTPSYDGPIQDVTSDSLACNGPPNPTMPTDKIIDVTAGSTVTAVWRHTLDSGPGDVMDASHKGPTLAYLKKVSSATSDKGVGNGWFKIQEEGYSNGVWATSKVIDNAGKHAIKIPDCIEDGQYLLRAEMIALHAAGSAGGAQLYMECAQINIKGGKATKTPTTYSIPGIYKANDPGLLINIYGSMAGGYEIPGPDPFTCSASGNSPGTPGTPTTIVTSTKAATPAPTSNPGGCAAAKWAQCGGSGYTGCKSCESGSKCVATNEWYSQCQ